MADIKDVSKDNFATDVLGADNLTLVYFHAPWCNDCKKSAEVINAAAAEVGEQVTLVRVNTDQESEIVTQQNVRTIPFFKVFFKGKEVDALNGLPSKLELIGMLSNAVSEHLETKNAPDASTQDEQKEE